MKFIRPLSAGLCGLGLLVAAVAQQNPNPIKFELPQVGSGANPPAKQAPATTPPANQPAAQPATQPAAPTIKYTDDQLMEVYGWMLATRMNLSQLEFTPAQIEAMAQGMTMAVKGQQPSYDPQQVGPQLQELLQKKQQNLLLKVRNANLVATAEYFTKLKDKAGVKEIDGSGLRYEVVKQGSGAVAKPGQIATIHYTGAFVNGQVFDTSLQAPEGQQPEPVDVLVQDGALIPGMIEALKRMPVGSKWLVHIPPQFAYGDDGAPGIPPGAALIFEVEVLGVKDAPKQEPAKDAKK